MKYPPEISRRLPTINQTAVGSCIFLALAATGTMRAQIAETSSPYRHKGFAISNITFFNAFYSPGDTSSLPHSTYDTVIGGGAMVSWTKALPKFNIAINYVPSYTRDFSRNLSYSSLSNPLSQIFSFTMNRRVNSMWAVNGGASASVITTNDFLFSGNQFSQLTRVATTPDELAAAVLPGSTYDNAQLTDLLSRAPLLDSPARRQLYGDRVFTASFHGAATYTRSRLLVTVSGAGSRVQALSTDRPPTNTILTPYLLVSATSGQADVNVSYALSPRTRIGVSVGEIETVSRLQNSYTTTITAHLERRMGMYWVLDLHGGTGITAAVRSVYDVPSGPQVQAGGTLGLKLASHTVLFSAERSAVDQYGLGASSTLASTVGWNWGNPRRGWRVSASGGAQQFRVPGFQTLTGWQGTAAFSQTLSRSLAAVVEYAYLQNSRNLSGMPGNWSANGVRMGLVWNPWH